MSCSVDLLSKISIFSPAYSNPCNPVVIVLISCPIIVIKVRHVVNPVIKSCNANLSSKNGSPSPADNNPIVILVVPIL